MEGVISADEFEKGYAARSGITVERLRELGRVVAPCSCGQEGCEGWQSTTAQRLADDADDELFRAMFHPDPAIGRRAKQLYDAKHAGDPAPKEPPRCAECFEGCPKCQPEAFRF